MDMINSYFPRLIARELELAANTPQDLTPLLAGSGLSWQHIYEQPELGLKDFVTFLSNALKYSQDPSLGLRFGRHSQPYLFGEMAFASINAPNLLESLLGFVNYSGIQASYFRFEMSSDLHYLTIRAHILMDLGDTRRTQLEVAALTLQNFLELFLGQAFDQGKYIFEYSQPEYGDKYSNYFHSPVEFNGTKTCVKIPNTLLKLPSMHYDEKLWLQGKLRCAALMQAVSNRQHNLFSQHVLAKLNYRPPPIPNVQTIATELNVSQRTLARRLKQEGTSFRALHQQVQQHWAKHFLQQSILTVENIAMELGFQDSANFRRAFKRHWHMTPQAYRLTCRDNDAKLS